MLKSLKEFVLEKSFLCVAFVSLASLGAIVGFLFMEGYPVLESVSLKSFLTGSDWYPTDNPPAFGILPLAAASFSTTILASLFAIPLGIACAVYLNEMAPESVRRVVKPLIELIAAMPSVVIGFIGMAAVAPILQDWFGAASGLNLFNASILLAFMAVPLICTISEDALRAVPVSLREASLAVGATPWETLAKVTLPSAAPGITTAVMLGMSRVIGETMVVLMVAGGAAILPESLFDPVRPLPASIAAEMAEAPFRGSHYHALFAAGIVLFIFTFIFNAVAFKVSSKYKANHV